MDEWHAQHRPDFEGIRIVGFQWSPRSHQIKEFFSGNLVPYTWIDVKEEWEEAAPFLDSAGISRSELPLVVYADGSPAADPALSEIAERVGLQITASAEVYDVVIVGAGPAGLAAGRVWSQRGAQDALGRAAFPWRPGRN